MHWSVCKIKNVYAKLFIILLHFRAVTLVLDWKLIFLQSNMSFITPIIHLYSTVSSQSDVEHISDIHLEIWKLFCKSLVDSFNWRPSIRDFGHIDVDFISISFLYLWPMNNLCVFETKSSCLINLSAPVTTNSTVNIINTVFLKCSITLLSLFIRQALHDGILLLKRKSPPFRVETILQCAHRTPLWVAILNNLTMLCWRVPLQTSCSIWNWFLPILFISSASHIKCSHSYFVYILLQIVMWILLSNVLYVP